MALPDDRALLRARDIDGMAGVDIAVKYGVAVDQVYERFAAIGRDDNPARQRETEELMDAIRHYKATGHGAENAVLLGHGRGWEPARICSRTGVDLATVERILAAAA